MGTINDLLGDFGEFALDYYEALEQFLRNVMSDQAIIYGIPWWQWVLGGSFILALLTVTVFRLLD